MNSHSIKVGRYNTNDVPVEDKSVSGHHLTLTIHSLNEITLADEQSSYGSYYWNGQDWQQFNQIQLSSNDYIIIGNSKLRIMEIIIAYQIRQRRQGL